MTSPAPIARRTQDRWLTHEPGPGGRLRLFCFHHAGGAASAFADWPAALGPEVDVLPVQLPGREYRAGEPRIRDVATLVDELDRHLRPLLRTPYAFYGHSMGALVAYAFTRHLQAHNAPLPRRLLVGAYPAPHLGPPLRELTFRDDEDVARWLVSIGGMSAELLRYPAWAGAAVALLRDDLAVCHSYRHRETEPLRVPIDVFRGASDPLLPAERVADWPLHTTAPAAIHTIAGGHFFVGDDPEGFFRALRAALPPLGTATRRAAGTPVPR